MKFEFIKNKMFHFKQTEAYEIVSEVNNKQNSKQFLNVSTHEM